MEDINGTPRIKVIARLMFYTGAINITFIFLIFAIARIGFLFHIPISPYHLALAFALTAIAGVFLARYYFGQKRSAYLTAVLAGLILFLAISLSSWAIADHFYDVSFDGQWYHQGTVRLLMNGFNPLYDQAPVNYPGALFIDHYPNAFETMAAVINAFTHHVEDGKLLNIFLMITSFLIVFPVIIYVFRGVNWAFALVIALLSAFNPVCIYQSLSYYVDGASASLLAILVFLLILSFKKMGWPIFLMMTGVIVLAVNIKFFNLAYAGILVAGSVAICFIYHKPARLPQFLILSLLIGLLFGAAPYITNLIDHGTPFYPVNSISTDIIAGDVPANLNGKNPVEQLLVSIFSLSDYSKSDAVLKIPLLVSSKELASFHTTDTRAGGFGPLFSAIFLFAVLLAIIVLTVKNNEKDPLNKVVLLLCLLLCITVLVNPASWWARYVPQLWSVPLLLLLCAQQRLTGKLKVLNYGLILLLVLNVALIAFSYYGYQLAVTDQMDRQIDDIRSLTQNRPAQLYCGIFIAAQDRYQEKGINFVLTDTPPDRQWSTLAEAVASYGYVTFY